MQKQLYLLLHGKRLLTVYINRPTPAAGGLVELDVDPNEPRYCICNQVSFGDMVACDGENVRSSKLERRIVRGVTDMFLLSVRKGMVPLRMRGSCRASSRKMVLRRLCSRGQI